MKTFYTIVFTLLCVLVTHNLAKAQNPDRPHAFSFDGKGDRVDIPNLNLTTDTITMELWVNPRTITSDLTGILFSRRLNNGLGIMINKDGEIRYTWNNQHHNTTTGVYATLNQWNHVALVITATKAEIYANGDRAVVTAVHADDYFNADNIFSIGADPVLPVRYFDGLIDEVRIWNTALDSAELVSRMHKKITSTDTKYSDLVAYYQADMGTGTTALDTSGNNLDATLVGDATWYDLTAIHGDNSVFASEVRDYELQDTSAVRRSNHAWTLASGGTIKTKTNYDVNIEWGTNVGNTYNLEFTANYSNWDGAVKTTYPVLMRAPSNDRPHAMSFDGDGDRVDIPDLNLTTDTITMEFWVNPRTINSDFTGLLFSRRLNSGLGLMINKDGEIRYTWNNTHHNVTTGIYATLNQWNHVALVISATKAEFYVNGNKKVINQAHTDDYFNSDNVFSIGADPTLPVRYFDGLIDEVRIWDTALDSAEIVDRMHEQITSADPKFSDLVVYYQADLGTGTTARDTSGHDLDAKFVGDATWYDLTQINGESRVLANSTKNYELGDTSAVRRSNYSWTLASGGTINSKTHQNAWINWADTNGAFNIEFSANYSNWDGPVKTTVPVKVQSISEVPHALDFGGTGYVSVDDNDKFDVNKFTLETWVKWDAQNGAINFITSKWGVSSTNEEQFEIHTYGTPGNYGLRFIPTTDVFLDVDNSITPGEWTHIAYTYDPSDTANTKIYVNGEKRAYKSNGPNGIKTGFTYNPDIFNIGRRGDNTFYWDGLIDEVRFWDTVLTQTDIQNRMHARITSADTYSDNLVAYYQKDENSDTVLHDFSKNSLNGRFVNTVVWTNLQDTITITGKSTVLAGVSEWYAYDKKNTDSRHYNYDWSVNGGTIKTAQGDSVLIKWNSTAGSGYIDLTVSNSNHPTEVDATRFRVSRTKPTAPYALSFDGTDDYIKVAQHVDFTTDLEDALTFETWIRPNKITGNMNVAGVWNNGGGGKNSFLLGQQGASLYFYVSPDGSSNQYYAGAVNSVVTNEWIHVAGTFDGDSVRIYINGEKQGTGYVGKDIYNGSDLGAFQIGKTQAFFGPVYDGLIDEVRIWNTTLSQQDIQDRMHAKLTSKDSKWSNLVLYYQMDENDGNTVIDYSDNGHNGANMNGTAWELLNVSNFTIAGEDTLHLDSTGTYEYSLNADDARLYNYNWSSTGSPTTSVNADTSAFTIKYNAYTAKDTLKLWARHSNFDLIREDATDFVLTRTQNREVIKVTSPDKDGGYSRDTVVYVYVIYNGPVLVSGTPTLEMEVGATDKPATYVSGSGTDTLVFKYTVVTGDYTTDFDYTSTTALTGNGGSITDNGGNNADTTLPAPGTPNSLGSEKTIIVDGDPAYIANVTSSTPNGHYKSGNFITVRLEFDQTVQVSGRPLLELETGNTDTKVRFATGSGTSYSFIYKVGSGDATLDLDYTSSSALTPNGGSFVDQNGIAIDWTLPKPGATGSLGSNKNIVIDNTPPQVTNVTSTTPNGSYTVGDDIEITVTFDEVVEVTGVPQLELTTDTIDYVSGSGSTTITFKYTVKPGDDATDLEYKTISSFLIGKSTVSDKAGNDAVTTLPTPGQTGSIGNNKNIVVDTKKPTITSVTGVPSTGTKLSGDTVWIDVKYTELVYVDQTSGTPTIDLETGDNDKTATYHSGTGTSTLRFYYVVEDGDETDDLDYKSPTSFSTNGGTITDKAGNDSDNEMAKPGDPNSLGGSSTIIVDGNPPSIVRIQAKNKNGTVGIGDTVFVNVEYDQEVTVSGNPSFELETGKTDQTAKYFGGSGTSTIVYYYIVQKGDETSDLDYKSTSISTNGGSMTDKNGNAAETDLPSKGKGTLGDNSDIEVDGVPAQVVEVTSTTPDGSYTVGKTVTVKVKYDEEVWITGTPRIELSTGGYATYVSGSGTDEIIFEYTIGTGENSTDLNYKSTTSFTTNGGSITDKGGNDAELDLPATTSSTSLGGGSNIIVDTKSPAITKVQANPTSGSYKPGDKISIEITTDEVVYVDETSGTPCITVEVGDVDRQACYVSGSGTSKLVFEYTVQDGDESTDLEYVPNSFSLNGSSVTDKAGNSIDKTLPAIPSSNSLGGSSSIDVDGVGPELISVSTTNPDGSYKIGDQVDIVLEYDEDVIITGTPCITLETGGVDRTACYVSGSGTDKITFRYTIQDGDETGELDYKGTTALKLNGGTLKDRRGNDGDIELPSPGKGSLVDNHQIEIDGVPPVIINVTSTPSSGNIGIGDTVIVCTEYDDVVTVTGSPSLLLETGNTDRAATYIGGSGTTTLCYMYIVQENDSTNDLNYVQPGVIDNNGGTVVDNNGNDAKTDLPADNSGGSLGDNSNTKVDGKKPTVKNVGTTNPDGTYSAGDTIFIEIQTDEVVCVDGKPVLNLKNGKKAVYHSGACGDKIIFRYVIDKNDSTISLEYDYPNSIDTTNGTIKDKVGNDLDLDIPNPGGGNSLGDNTNIKINATPSVTTVGSTQICENDDVYQANFTIADRDDAESTLTVTATSSNEFVVPVGNIVFGGADGNRTLTVSPAKDVFGSSTITVTIADDDNAMATTTFNVVVHAKPDADFRVANNCDYETTEFDNESEINSGHIVNYAWNFADGNSASTQNPSHFYGTAGTYAVELIATSNYGCADSASQTVEVYKKPTAEFTISDVCFREASAFKNTSNLGSEYLWDFGDEWGISTLENPEYLFSKPGQYTATLFVVSANGCRDTVSNITTVFALPAAEFEADNHCFNEEMAPTSLSSGNIAAYDWQFGDGNNDNVEAPFYTYTADGEYAISLEVTSDDGCTDVTSHNVTVHPLPVVTTSNDTMVSKGYQAHLVAKGGVAYIWSPIEQLDRPRKATTNAIVLEDISYVVTVASEFGCVDTASVNLRVREDYTLEPSNILTPDGNGKNDNWIVEKAQYYNNVEVLVFDRWGRIVYQSTAYDNTWNGTNSNGDLLPDGAYFYVVKVPADREEYKGSITIFR